MHLFPYTALHDSANHLGNNRMLIKIHIVMFQTCRMEQIIILSGCQMASQNKTQYFLLSLLLKEMLKRDSPMKLGVHFPTTGVGCYA